MNHQLKFAIYTSFYNTSKYIDRLYENIMSIDYTDFTWFVTDDYSNDDTKQNLLEKIKDNTKIVYVEQNHKM
jgi:glycosyltransferase involved in cell wall biosynthesis